MSACVLLGLLSIVLPCRTKCFDTGTSFLGLLTLTGDVELRIVFLVVLVKAFVVIMVFVLEVTVVFFGAIKHFVLVNVLVVDLRTTLASRAKRERRLRQLLVDFSARLCGLDGLPNSLNGWSDLVTHWSSLLKAIGSWESWILLGDYRLLILDIAIDDDGLGPGNATYVLLSSRRSWDKARCRRKAEEGSGHSGRSWSRGTARFKTRIRSKIVTNPLF